MFDPHRINKRQKYNSHKGQINQQKVLLKSGKSRAVTQEEIDYWVNIIADSDLNRTFRMIMPFFKEHFHTEHFIGSIKFGQRKPIETENTGFAFENTFYKDLFSQNSEYTRTKSLGEVINNILETAEIAWDAFDKHLPFIKMILRQTQAAINYENYKAIPYQQKSIKFEQRSIPIIEEPPEEYNRNNLLSDINIFDVVQTNYDVVGTETYQPSPYVACIFNYSNLVPGDISYRNVSTSYNQVSQYANKTLWNQMDSSIGPFEINFTTEDLINIHYGVYPTVFPPPEQDPVFFMCHSTDPFDNFIGFLLHFVVEFTFDFYFTYVE